MKKFPLFLTIMLCFGLTMKAQTYVGDLPHDEFNVIPGYFTTSGHPYVVQWVDDEDENQYWSLYQSDFTTHLTDINTNLFDHAVDIRFQDFDASPDKTHIEIGDGEWVFLTQTLFNDDEYFEYFETNGETITHYDTVFYDEETYEVYQWQDYHTTSISIKSTNGGTVWSYNSEEGCTVAGLIKFDNSFYLVIHTDRILLYLIKQNQGLIKVNTPLPISVFPTMPTRDEQITVELGEGTNATEITVVNSLGQVVKRMSVDEGQRTITIPARELGSGLNVVNTKTKQGQGSCKIIVH